MLMHKFHSNKEPSFGLSLLTKYTILQAEGADAAAFLQGQFSQDVLKLEDQGACFAGLSNPKGRLIANTYIYKNSSELYLLVLPNAMLAEVQKQLSKYVMRSKVKFSQRTDLNLYGLWNAENDHLKDFKHTLKLAEHANLYFAICENEIQANLQTEQEWAFNRILNAIPEVNPETQEHFVAQMLNMDVLNGISFQKGCYTGQEVIARMQHLGRIKRRTLLLETNKNYLPGEKIQHADKTIGEVVDSIEFDTQKFILAVIQLDKLRDINNEDLYQKSGFKIFKPAYELEQTV